MDIFIFYFNNMYECERCLKQYKRFSFLQKHRTSKKMCRLNVDDTVKPNIDQTKVEAIDENTENVKSKYPLTPFDLELDYSTGNVLGFLMSSRSGKTTLCKYIYHNYFEDPNLVSILYALNLSNKIYDDYGDKKTLIKTYNFMPEVVQMQYKIQKKTKNKYNFLNMIDDGASGIKNNRVLGKMITTYRNSKMSAMITAQYSKQFSKENRTNFNYIFFGNQNTDEAIKDIIKDFVGGMFNGMKISIEEKVAIYRECTKDYRFIMMNMMTNDLSYHKLRFE